MVEVHVKDAPGTFVLEKDGRLSLRSLKLDPDNIRIQGRRELVGPNGVTKFTWIELLQTLTQLEEDTQKLGTTENPLQVAGDALSGGSAMFGTVLALSVDSLLGWRRSIVPPPIDSPILAHSRLLLLQVWDCACRHPGCYLWHC